MPRRPRRSGVIERFFRSLKEECIWQRRFRDFQQASRTIRQWMDWYNVHRPHQSLGYVSPSMLREQQQQRVA